MEGTEILMKGNLETAQSRVHELEDRCRTYESKQLNLDQYKGKVQDSVKLVRCYFFLNAASIQHSLGQRKVYRAQP